MSRYEHHDIMMELIELCREQKSDILQQLNYYRASVYKTETAAIIERKIEQMQLCASLIGDEVLSDAFRDYEETRKNSHLLIAPGECLLSTRVMNLFKACDTIFEAQSSQAQLQIKQRQPADRQLLSRKVQRHRGELLSMCRQGSRPWAFFSTF